MKSKTQLTLLIVVLQGLVTAIPTTVLAGNDHHRHGHNVGHSYHFDRHHRGYSHPRHHYKRHGRHNHYYGQPGGYYKGKHRHHYRSRHYYPKPRYIIEYNYNHHGYLKPSYGYPPNPIYGFNTGNSHFMLRY